MTQGTTDLTKTTDSQRVREFTGGMPLSFARPINRYGSTTAVGGLPRHRDLHWRGLWHPASGRVYGKFSPFDDLLECVPPRSRRKPFEPWDGSILCHSKPIDDAREPVGSESRYPDIPDRLDVYLLLRHQFDAIAFAGRTIAATIRRTEETFSTILQLREWELDREGGRYRRTRGRSQLARSLAREPTRTEIERQHAASALRAIGLKWPRKPNDRQRQWKQCLIDLGLTVEVTSDLAPLRHRATSLEMQEQLARKWGWR